MKVRIKSVLKTSDNSVDCFEEQQVLIKSGNTLCIKEIGKNESQFICLHPELQHLFTFKPSTTRKGVFTAQKVGNGIDIAYYSLRGTRKAIPLALQPSFIAQIEKIELLVDEYDNNMIFGGLKSKQGACIFVADMSKNKVLAQGYMRSYEDIKLDFRENLTLSVLCNNGTHNKLKSLRYVSGQWEITQELYKKIQGVVATRHELLPCGRIVFIAKGVLYHLEGSELLQTIEMKNQRIRDMVRVNRGLLLLGQKDTVDVLVEDNDEVTLLLKGTLKLQLQAKDSINSMFLSFNGEQVMIGTKRNNIYCWKCQYIDLEPNHFDFSFIKIHSSCSSSKQGTLSLSTGKKYCMLAGDKNVTLWSVEKNEFILSSDFSSNVETDKDKVVRCCAINPDGNSFILGFQDKVRVYRILLTKFKLITEYSIKKCCNLVYSNGGQLFACRFGTGVNSCIKIINNLRMCQVGQLKVGAQPTNIIWNELDDEILVSTDTNVVQVFSVAQTQRTGFHSFDSKINLVRMDYRTRNIMMSFDKKVVVATQAHIIEEYRPPFEDFHYIFPLYGVYFIVTKGGMLHWSSSSKFETYQSFSLFTGKPFSLICRARNLLAYSSFEDVIILNCLSEQKKEKNVQADDIVMVQRQQILQFYDKVRMIENNFEMMQSATQVKLEDEKAKYEDALFKFKSQFTNQIKEVSYRLSDMSNHKLKQERQTEKVFEHLEQGQVKNVGQIEDMYQRKCHLLQDKVLGLQQDNLQQKKRYEGLLCQLQQKYHNDIGYIRGRFEQKMKEECSKADEIKLNVLEDKKRMQFRLVELEEENEVTVLDVQMNKDTIIQKMRANIDRLESQIEQVQIKRQTVVNENQRLLEQNHQKKKAYQFLSDKYEEATNRINLLQKDVFSKKQMIEDKDRSITELTHQVGGLEKAKYVLSFRTNQIRKELQPKEQLTDRLKSQLQKVEEEYKEMKKKNFQQSQRLQKSSKLNQTLKKQLNDTKQALKLKQSKHTDLLKKINFIVHEVKEKQWGQKLRKLDSRYCSEAKYQQSTEKSKKDPTEELNRHLRHVQTSLQHVSFSNDKILRGKEKDISRRLKQNSELMLEINIKKKNEIMLKQANQQLVEEKSILKKQLDQNYDTKRNSTRAQTSMTKRRAASRDEMHSRQKSFVMSRPGSKQKDLKDILKDRSRIESSHKTLMYRDDTREKNTKFFYIARQLQSARNTIKVQEEMLEELNKQMFQQNSAN